MSILALKKEYNQTLHRYHKAYEYLGKDIPEVEKEKWAGDYQEILDNLNRLVTELNKIIVFDSREILEGFELD